MIIFLLQDCKMATAQLNRTRTAKKLEKPRPLKLNQRNSTVDGRITTGKFFIIRFNKIGYFMGDCIFYS